MAVHANSLANLVPFKKGYDPNRSCTRSQGASLIEWMNRLDVVSTDELKEIAAAPNGPDNPQSKGAAAETILRMRTEGFAKNGKPLAADDLDRILDRTHGRAVQRVEVVTKEERDPDALRLELLELLADHPELRQVMAGEMAAVDTRTLPEPEAVRGEDSADV